ncbi:MAG: D-mannose binding lectin [Pseudonocardiales bacterium]|nr:D-mannose binding lectin [Pseudonocardiales bacterium]
MLASLIVAFHGAAPAQADSASSLTRGTRLASSQRLVSANGTYQLIMQTDGNLVQYGPDGVRWQTGTQGYNGATLVMQTDGNVVLAAASGQPLWNTGTFGANAASRFTLQDDGNQVAYNSAGAAVYSAGTSKSTSPVFRSSDRRFVAQVQGDGNFVLTYQNSGSADVLWSSQTGGHPNALLVVQSDGNMVIYDGGRAIWQTGSSGYPGAAVSLQADGNLVLRSPSGRVLFTSGTDSAAAGIQTPGDGRFTLAWAHALADRGTPIGLGSPSVGTLDGGGPAAIVGSRAGTLNAYHLSDGSSVPGWPVGTGGVAVDSTPSVVGSGAGAQVYVGLGTSGRPDAGGLLSLSGNGSVRWNRLFWAFPGSNGSGGSGLAGVQGSPAIGRLQSPAGQYDITAGSMGQMQYAFNSNTGNALPGFPWFAADSNFSTPALADLYGRGTDVIIEGGDSTAGNAFYTQYGNGGHIRIINPTGWSGSTSYNGGVRPSDGLVCQYNTDQVVQSSPAVGPIFGGGVTGIVAGTGTYYAGASDTNKLIAIDKNCTMIWKANLDGPTGSSPALIDVLGNNTLAVVEGTNKSPTSGTVYALNGATGQPLWATAIAGGVYGSITSIDLGGGYESLLVPTATGVFILDGKTGRAVSKLVNYIGVQNTVLVTADPGGNIGVTVAGYNGVGNSVVMHFRLTGSSVSTVSAKGQWPMFHANPQLTGVAPSPS